MARIAVQGPGELGTTLGTLLVERGHEVLMVVTGRSARSRGRCERAGLPVAEGLGAALYAADIVVSTVTPDRALAAAEDVAGAMRGSARRPIHVDANSISPATGRRIAELIEEAGGDAVGAGIAGSRAALGRTGQMFVAGGRAAPVAAVMSDALRVVELGTDPGRAKELRLLYSAFSKGVCALMLEGARTAGRAGLLDELIDAVGHAYPQMMAGLDRMIPSYPDHAGRRIGELAELVAMTDHHGVEPRMAGAALEVVREAAERLEGARPPVGAVWTTRAVVRALEGE